MDLKEQYRTLIGTIQSKYQAKTGGKLTIGKLAKEVGLNRVTVQNLISGKVNVLQKHIDTATEVYSDLLQNTTIQNFSVTDRDRLIASLERENKLLQDLVRDLREKILSRLDLIDISLGEIREGQKAVAGVAHAALFHAENISAFQQNKNLVEVQKISDKIIFERMKQIEA